MSDGTPLLEKIQNFVTPSNQPNMDSSTSHSVFPNDNANSSYQNYDQAAIDKAQSAVDYARDNINSSSQGSNLNPTAQNVKETVTNGPLAQGVKSEYANTRSEFQNLANSRQRPNETTATGQQLTHYHSMFYNLLSWENPRATAIAYLTSVAFIFATRYLPVLRYFFKGLYLTLGVTGAAEIAGRLLFNNGFATQIRPRRYYTLPKDSVDRFMDDVHELLNFFVIEFQRIVFAENIGITITAFLFSLLSYFLIRLVPMWGFALISTTFLYITPLIYVNNKEFIDNQLRNLSQMLNQQAVQVKDLATQNAAKAKERAQIYARDYSAKTQQYVGAAKQRVASQTKDATNAASNAANNAASTAQRNNPLSGSGDAQQYRSSDFPNAPTSGPTPIADQFASAGHGINGDTASKLRNENDPVVAI